VAGKKERQAMTFFQVEWAGSYRHISGVGTGELAGVAFRCLIKKGTDEVLELGVDGAVGQLEKQVADLVAA